MTLLVSLLRAGYQLAGLFFALLAIPLAFDVGGEQCGVAFSFVLSVFYLVLCTNRWLFRRTKLYPFTSLLYYFQVGIIPSLLLVHLSYCPRLPWWLARAMLPWEQLLAYATGLFTLLEGFCALVVVQACGRLLAPRLSEPLFFLVLAAASVVLSADFYLLMRVYLLPDVVGVTTATLIGAALTLGVTVGVYGIWSRRGGVVESTLLMSYIVYQIYLALTDFQSARALSVPNLWATLAPGEDEWPPRLAVAQLPPAITEGVAGFMRTAAALTPQGIKAMWAFSCATLSAVSPSVLVSLLVRLASYLVALRLVPFVRHQTPNARQARSRIVAAVYAYSPVLIIAVYTHLLLQHFGQIVHGSPDVPQVMPFDATKIWRNSRQAWQFWSWANVFSVLFFYGIELAIGPPPAPLEVDDDDDDEAIEIDS